MDLNDKELEQLLVETLKLSRENNDYLKKVDRRLRWSRNWTVFYWVFIIALALTGYYVAFPYLQTAKDEFGGVTKQIGQFVNLGGQVMSNPASTPTATAQKPNK